MKQWFHLLKCPFDSLDKATQTKVFRSFYHYIHRDIFSMIHDRMLTDDIIQEAFIKAVASGPKLRSDLHISAWVKQVARNTTIDWLRRRRKERQLLEVMSVSTNEIGVAHEIMNLERDVLLHQALEELKPDYQKVLQLFYIEEQSYREICRELQISEGALAQRLARARKKLHDHFSKKWNSPDE